MSETLSQPLLCLRCKTEPLVVLQSDAKIAFFECPRCGRGYAKQPGAALVFRWLNPLSLALYGVIYAEDAIPQAAITAEQLARDRDAATITALADEIELELADPTQPVAQMLPMAVPKTEEHLREFLRLVAKHLRRAAARTERV